MCDGRKVERLLALLVKPRGEDLLRSALRRDGRFQLKEQVSPDPEGYWTFPVGEQLGAHRYSWHLKLEREAVPGAQPGVEPYVPTQPTTSYEPSKKEETIIVIDGDDPNVVAVSPRPKTYQQVTQLVGHVATKRIRMDQPPEDTLSFTEEEWANELAGDL